MASYGWTADGFVVPTWQDLRDFYAARARSYFGADVDTRSTTMLGKWLDLYADTALDQWQQLGRVVAGLSTDGAAGVHLDNLADVLGLSPLRIPAAASVVTLEFDNDSAADITVPAGTGWRLVADPDIVFETDEAVAVPAGGSASVAATATTTGPTEVVAHAAGSGAWSVVETFPGYTSIDTYNTVAATAGRDRETDAELRTRIVLQRYNAYGTDAAIRNALLAVTGVDEAVVVSNRSATTDADGRPAYTWEAIVWGESGLAAVEDEIAAAIWARQPAGGRGSYGTTTATLTLSNGRVESVSWSEATTDDVDVRVASLELAASAPADAQAQISAAVDAYFDGLAIGVDVLDAKVQAAVLCFSWVESATVTMRVSPASYATSDIAVGARARAVLAGGAVEFV